MSLLHRLHRYVSALGAEQPVAPPPPEVKEAEPGPQPEATPCASCAELRRELERQHRIKDDYWNVIERLQTQRDGWAQMYNDSCSKHQSAQLLLEAALCEARNRLGKAIAWLNEYREKAGEKSPLVPPPDHIEPRGAPVGEAERYMAFLRTLDTKAPHPLDGLAERAAIATKHGDAPPVEAYLKDSMKPTP